METAEQRQTRVEHEMRETLLAAHREGNPVAIWMMGINQLESDPAHGGLVVGFNSDALGEDVYARIENAQTRTITHILISEMADVQIERP